MKIQLDLLKLSDQLRIQKEGGKSFIWDPLRKKNLVLAPEEMVRQLLVQYLIQDCDYSPNRMAIEKMIKVNGMDKRCDILCFDDNYLPWMLIECKSPSVKISEATFRQIAMYNLPLRVPFLLVSNGPDSYCCSMDYDNESFSFLKQLPAYGESP